MVGGHWQHARILLGRRQRFVHVPAEVHAHPTGPSARPIGLAADHGRCLYASAGDLGGQVVQQTLGRGPGQPGEQGRGNAGASLVGYLSSRVGITPDATDHADYFEAGDAAGAACVDCRATQGVDH